MSGIIFCHLLHTLWCECDMKSAAADRKKECQINFISNLFTLCQLKSQIHMVRYCLFSIVVPTCTIFKFLFKFLILIKLIIDIVYMHRYNWKAKRISCVLFDSYSSFTFVGTHEHDKVVAHSC